jgi:hypothetical protein
VCILLGYWSFARWKWDHMFCVWQVLHIKCIWCISYNCSLKTVNASDTVSRELPFVTFQSFFFVAYIDSLIISCFNEMSRPWFMWHEIICWCPHGTCEDLYFYLRG